MNPHFARLITTVGIALLAPAFVVAQVEKVETRPAAPRVEAPKVAPPVVDPLGAARREAEAKKKEREAMFAKIRGMAAGEAAPAVVDPRAQNARILDQMFKIIKGQNARPEAVKPPLRGVQRVNVEAQLEAQKKMMVPQYLTHLRPNLMVEYRFLRTVCAPSKEQRRPIARAGLAGLKDAATAFVEWQYDPARRARPNDQPNPRHIIEEALAAAAKENLTPDQQERYRYELEDRAAERKRFAILTLVAKLDQCLILSSKQRDAISEALSARWNDSWWQGIQNYSLESNYFPLLPDDGIVPFLKDAQRKIWTGLQKTTYSAFGFGGMGMENGPLDDEFPDEPPPDGPIPGPKPEAKK